jgi:hypothetical protein
VYATPSSDSSKVRVRLSLHGLKPNQRYVVKASRHACHGVTASHFEGGTDCIVWSVVARTQPVADDLYTGKQPTVKAGKDPRGAKAVYISELADDGTATPLSCGQIRNAG